MSETDSFIEEVTEEVRRDRLFGYMRKYGWIAILAVILLVGGATYNEWSKARIRAAAEARGDRILAALEAATPEERAQALAEIDDAGTAQPAVDMLRASVALEAGDREGAIAALRKIADDPQAPQVYRDIATLKLVVLTADQTTPEERIAMLQPLAVPGAPLRALAEEQIALAEIARGDRQAAVERLRALVNDTEASQGLRLRARQLIVALGEEAEPA